MSSHLHGELYPRHHRIDGRDIELLDVVGFEHDGGVEDPSQPENVAVGASRWWRTGKVDPAEAAAVLAPHLVDGPALLGNGGAAVPEEQAMRGMDASLALVRPQGTEFHLERPRTGTSRLRPRVGFDLAGGHYDLALRERASVS